MRTTRAMLIVASATLMTGLGAACQSNDGGGTGGAAGATISASGTGGAMGSGGSGGASTSAATGGGGATAGTGGSGAGGMVNAADFAGIDMTQVPMGMAPSGCEGGFDAAAGALALTLDAKVTFVMIGVVADHIQANGVDCTAKDGSFATPSATKRIDVTGTAGDDALLIDLATGSFGDLFAKETGIVADLAAGKDRVLVRGSNGNDAMRVGDDAGELVIDAEGKGHTNVRVKAADSFAASFGPGADDFAGTGFGAFGATKMSLAVFGDDGDDQLQGGDGNDELHGGAGDDTFRTAATKDGADTYDGGPGSDIVDYGARTAALTVSIDGKPGSGEPGEGDRLQTSCEGIIGGAGNDVLTGGPGDDTIRGGGGNDIIHGGPGNDSLLGEDGDDQLYGDDGDDDLFGDQGSDKLFGGPGADVLDGGMGIDQFDGGTGDGDICLLDKSESQKNCELY